MRKTYVTLCVAFYGNLQAMSLGEAYRSALLQSAAIQNAQTEQRITELNKSQAWSALRPNLALKAQYQVRDQAEHEASFLSDTAQYNARLSLEQPLYRGGAEYAALEIADEKVQLSSEHLQNEEVTLYRKVAEVYFQWLLNQTETANLKLEIDLLKQQIETLAARVAIGKSKVSDTLQVKSLLAKIDADLARLASEQAVHRSELEWLTGKSIDSVSPLQNTAPLPNDLKERLLQSAELRSLRHELAVLDLERTAQAAAYRPTLGLSGNYYLARNGTLSGSDWDVQLGLTWDLYSGGKDRDESLVRSLRVTQVQRQLEDRQKQLTAQFTGQQQRLEHAQMTLQKLEKAKKLAHESYRAQDDDYKLGLIPHLEVLRALETYLTAKRALDQQRVLNHLEWVRLHLIAGVIP